MDLPVFCQQLSVDLDGGTNTVAGVFERGRKRSVEKSEPVEAEGASAHDFHRLYGVR